MLAVIVEILMLVLLLLLLLFLLLLLPLSDIASVVASTAPVVVCSKMQPFQNEIKSYLLICN